MFSILFLGKGCNVGVIPLVYLASLLLQIARVGSDHLGKKMEVPTSGLGSKSLHGLKDPPLPSR